MNEERDEQTTEVRDTNERQGNTNIRRQSVTTATKVDAGIVARRIVYYVVGVIIALLALRIVLLLLAANEGSAFVDFVYAVSGLFAMPFYGMFNYTPTYGQSVFEISSLVAIIVYALIGMGIAKLFSLTKSEDAV
jgi:tetrahydromethanopterin S-methyltransferase subunit F